MARRKTTPIAESSPLEAAMISGEDLEERVTELSRELSMVLQRLRRERTRKNEGLKESLRVFQQFFDQNEEALLVFRPDSGEIVDANPAASRLFGRGREELIEKGPALFLETEVLHNFNQILAMPEVTDEARVLSYRGKNGDTGIVSFRVKAIKLPERTVMFLSFRDMSDEIRSKAEARFRQIKLTYSNRMASLGLLLAGVAHEISGLNSLIMYNAQLLADVWRDALPVLEGHYRERGDFPLGGPLLMFSEMREAVPKLLPETTDSASKIKKIVDGLSNVARDDKNSPDRNVDVNRMLRYIVSMFAEHMQKRSEHITLDLAEEAPPVRGNAGKLEHLFSSLVLNALQSLPNRNCAVSVSTRYRKDKNGLETKIRDEGVGMPRDLIDKFAEPSLATKLEAGGGLGLHAAHMIVRELRGTIEFDSEIGKGTTVTVTLPVGETAVLNTSL